MALLQLRVDLLNRGQGHTNNDQDARATEGEVLVRTNGCQSNKRNQRKV